MLAKKLEKGSYLLEATGDFICATSTKHDMVFTIEVDEKKLEIETCLHTNGSYGYPYAIRKEFHTYGGDLKLIVTHKSNQSYQLHNCIISITPMIKVN